MINRSTKTPQVALTRSAVTAIRTSVAREQAATIRRQVNQANGVKDLCACGGKVAFGLCMTCGNDCEE